MGKGKILVDNITLTGIVKWLNDNKDFVKETRDGSVSSFSTSDVQQYIRAGHLPRYMGNFDVVKVDNEYAKLYNIVEKE